MNSSHFLFITCSVGAEAALKREIAREHRDLKLAFSRPGFVTFKSELPLTADFGADFALRSVFARSFGLALGKGGLEGVLKLGGSLRQGDRYPVLHVWERDRFPPGQEPKGFDPFERARSVESKIRSADFDGHFSSQPEALLGDQVVDVIILEENEWWLGHHNHSNAHFSYPGGRWNKLQPEGAPSRAYLKIEEALSWSRIKLRSGESVVEIGSAPGGSSYYLRKQGLNVVGIDPGVMDASVLSSLGEGTFQHIKCPVARVGRQDLPKRVDWLLADMNVAPYITLAAVDRFQTRMKESLLGVILTLKLKDWSVADQVPSYLDQLRAMGFTQVRAAQLSTCRQEICVSGLTVQRDGT